jgi:hypothetical protein
MRNHNSPIDQSFYSDLLAHITYDMVSAYSTQKNVDRDVEEIRRRTAHEGLCFLTKTLPSLGKAIDRSLATASRLRVTGFKLKPDTKLPIFMGEAMSRVFRSDGIPWFATWKAALHCDWTFPFDVEEKYIAKHGSVVYETMVSCINKLREDLIADYSDRLDELTTHVFTVYFDVCLPAHMAKEVIPMLLAGIHEYGIIRCDPEEGRVECGDQAYVLRALRQVCYSLYKLELPYSREQEEKVLSQFTTSDRSLDFKVEQLSGIDKVLLTQARRLVRRVLGVVDPRAGLPKHGPGAVATGEIQSEKHNFVRYYERLAAFFPYDSWFYLNAAHLAEDLEGLQRLESQEAGTAKVVLVPKDSRGPRLISCEPLEYQWIQQALMGLIVEACETNRLTRGKVNFTYQTVNQTKALEGSDIETFFRYSTLDMKDASDLVSLELVKALVPDVWFEALYASRSPATKMPDGSVVQLRKFAPMGSAVCFPVEALVFWALSVSAQIVHGVSQATAVNETFVYGDDIICLTRNQEYIRQHLPSFGLKLNDDKCCTAGPFKESCGVDAFYGIDVTPARVRSVYGIGSKASYIASYVAYSNEFYKRNMLAASAYLEYHLNAVKRVGIPVVSDPNPSGLAFVRQDYSMPELLNINKRRLRYNRIFHKLEVSTWAVKSQSIMTETGNSYAFLLRLLVEKEREAAEADIMTAGVTRVTGKYPIAHRVKLVRAWTPLR